MNQHGWGGALGVVLLLVCGTPNIAFARTTIDQKTLLSLPIQELQRQGAAALHAGDPAQAIKIFSELAARQPRDAASQTLLAFSYHLTSQTNPEAVDLALAGYDLAARAESGQFWPLALAGYAAYEQGRYDESLSYLARGLLVRPTDQQAMAVLAAAAYMSGDAGLASVAAERVVALDGARNPALLRLAALALVAEGETARAEAYVRRLDQIAPTEAALLQPRLSQLIQTTALDQPIAAPVIDPTTVVQDSPSPDQISVDVAIILSQNTQREHTGMNLLDGLNLQYGYNRGVTRSLTRADGVPDGRSYQRVITDSISVPQLNYNLNLFNRGGQYYSVVARPQLTAYRGEESEFFVGRSLRVAVGGVNSSSLEQIDIGIDMRVTPLEITPKGTKVRIETGRSFLTADAAGTFNEALTTFRQKVAATAEIKFGETLLLSGLSESVDDKTYSKTPFLGSVPILRTFFNERNVTERRDSVLVLVTPSRPVTLAGQPWARAEHVRRLTEFWTTVVDPASNAALVQQRLSKMQLFTRMTKPDVKLPFLQSKNLATPSMLAELLPARTF